MRFLFALSLCCVALAGCQPGPTQPAQPDPAHAAISAHLRMVANDPASYQPVRWGVARPWRRVEEAREELVMARLDSQIARLQPQPAVAQQELRQRLAYLRTVRDTARLGVLITHAFREKNALGALVLDSTTLLVSPANQVLSYGHALPVPPPTK